MATVKYWMCGVLVLSFYIISVGSANAVLVPRNSVNNREMPTRSMSLISHLTYHSSIPTWRSRLDGTNHPKNEKSANLRRDDHRIVARNVGVGVHSVLNGRLNDGNSDVNRNVTRNVTRDEAGEIRKARITVISACSLSVITTAIFITFVYYRGKSKRQAKVGTIDNDHVDKASSVHETTEVRAQKAKLVIC